MENDIKKQIGWYLITVISTLLPLLTMLFASLGYDVVFVVVFDVLLAATAGLIYYVIKKYFGIPIEEPIVE